MGGGGDMRGGRDQSLVPGPPPGTRVSGASAYTWDAGGCGVMGCGAVGWSRVEWVGKAEISFPQASLGVEGRWRAQSQARWHQLLTRGKERALLLA